MSAIFGILGIDDTDRVFVATIGQRVVYDAITNLLERYNADLKAALGVFVEGETEDYKVRFKLPGGGRLQRLGRQAPPAEVRAVGQWDVAYPLEGFGAAVGGGRVDMAYMTVQDLDKHLDTVTIQDINTVRQEMLKALFNNNQDSFVDRLWGTLLIEPLANGDSVNYPPVLGSESEATEDHYLSAGFAASAISDTNNPYLTIVNELEEHFGAVTGGANIVTFIHPDEVPETQALTNFADVETLGIRLGDDTARAVGLPGNLPGRIIGRMSDGTWVVEWRWMPAAYMLGIHLEVARPLAIRVDPADTGLERGLALVARDEEYPLETSYWEHRFGMGASNRLNGVFMFVDAGAFAIPAGFT